MLISHPSRAHNAAGKVGHLDIFLEGDQTNQIYFILKGKVDVLKLDSKKVNNFRITTLNNGDYFGEMSWFLENNNSFSFSDFSNDRAILKYADLVIKINEWA